jgi:hypothetical protein
MFSVRAGKSRHVVGAVGALVLVLVSGTMAIAAVTPDPVLRGNGVDEGLGYSNTQYLTWTQNSIRRPRHFDAFARMLVGGPRTRLNAAGTQGFPGGFDPGTNTVIYQQQARSSQLFFFDLDTQTRTRVSGVNTRWWEWGPQISTTHILFNREFRQDGVWLNSMLLYDRETQTTLELDGWLSGRAFTPTGSVGEAQASWTVCTRSACRAFVYDIARGRIRRLPSADHRHEYAPVVDEVNGDVYFVESGERCGANAAIWRLPLDDFSVPATKIVDLPAGTDTGWVTTLAPNDSVTGSQDVFFQRWKCGPDEGDIYVARDATSTPDAPPGMPLSDHVPISSSVLRDRALPPAGDQIRHPWP